MRFVVIGAIVGCALIGPSLPAHAAMSCSQRNEQCMAFCTKQFKRQTGCTSKCADALPQCMSSGCWNTPMSNKCGYTKG
ncbi:hypothetical protein OPKNFCMD_4967 [Methylobacterium crusticola]|uniref:DUF3551 domain-containing protein n=1 Tax=Methylobacterium crusticola TaxID=1697972 RepID=A0ABQ4R4Z3_9HYPH|nr:hypothetical protein OPKNFCMD_4967 [Methylobacterium crusticola]